MNVYFETSALVKLFIEEPGAEEARDLWDEADLVTVTMIGYPEARAALAAAQRSGRLSPNELAELKSRFDRHWRQVQVVDFDQRLALSAGDLAEQFGLRGYDAVHLATAVSLHDESLVVATWDQELADACLESGLVVAPSAI